MDQGFNDDELADIMNEIENLEKEFTDEIQVKPAHDPIAEEMEAQGVIENEEEPAQEVEEVHAQEAEEEPAQEVEEVHAQEAEEEPVQEVEEVHAQEAEEEPAQEVEEVHAQEAEEEPAQEVEEVHAQESEDESDFESEEDEIHANNDISDDDFNAPKESYVVAQEIVEASSEDVIPSDPIAHDDSNIHSIHEEPMRAENEHVRPSSEKTKNGHSSMNFSVQGDMQLDMSFLISGKNVHLHINESGFEIELDDGMKFSIPLESHQGKKAA